MLSFYLSGLCSFFLSTSLLTYQISCLFCGQVHWAPVLSMVLTCVTLFIMSVITPWHNVLSESRIRVFWNRQDAMWSVVWLTTTRQSLLRPSSGLLSGYTADMNTASFTETSINLPKYTGSYFRELSFLNIAERTWALAVHQDCVPLFCTVTYLPW